jgi:hypothetical protein
MGDVRLDQLLLSFPTKSKLQVKEKGDNHLSMRIKRKYRSKQKRKGKARDSKGERGFVADPKRKTRPLKLILIASISLKASLIGTEHDHQETCK